MLHRVSPDVISMDIRLPGMNGFEATQRIMAEKPTPIVVVSASVEADDLKISMNALRAGALAVVEKPVGTSATHDYEALAERLCTQLVIMSQVKVIRQRVDRGTASARRAADAGTPPSGAVARPPAPFRMLGHRRLHRRAAGAGAAAGRPAGRLSRCRSLLVQHITASFLDGLRLLAGQRLPAAGRRWPRTARRRGRARSTWRRPTIICASSGGGLRLDRGEPVCLQRPSGTVLFQSMARSLGAGGARRAAHRHGRRRGRGAGGRSATRGGYTIAEDESTAVVYGMPAAAVRLGAVCEIAAAARDRAARLVELTRLRDRAGDADGPARTASCWSKTRATQAIKLRDVLEKEGWEVVWAATAEAGDGGDRPQRPGPDPARLLPAGHPRRRAVPPHPHEHRHARHPDPDADRRTRRTTPRLHGLESGADDFVPKSADADILLLRIRSLLSKASAPGVDPRPGRRRTSAAPGC